jgi:Tfp pilus assembly protein PilF
MASNSSFGNQEQARALWEEGVQELLEGRIQSAVDCFNQSLQACPSAEAYTYRGWAISFLGLLEQAIEDCRRAISIDPDFGNPYNDIGVYLMQLGLLEEAIPWLDNAKLAKRYEPRHFPYLNLGRIYVAKGDQARALDEYVKALDLDPENPIALEAIASLDLPEYE